MMKHVPTRTVEAIRNGSRCQRMEPLVTADSASALRLYATAANVDTQPPLCSAEAAGARRALNRTRQNASDGASPHAD